MNGAPTRPGRRRPSGDFCLNNPLHTIAARHLAHTDIIPPRAPRGRRSLKGEDMRVLKLFIVAAFAAAFLFSLARPSKVSGQSPTEAPAAFDNMTNGFEPQGTPVPTPDTNPTPGTFEADKFIFSIVDEIPDGLGPVYNAQSCRECHQNPVTGGIRQISEVRAAHSAHDGTFADAPGGSLINDRAIDPLIQERVPDGARIVACKNNAQIFVMGFDGGQYGEVINDPVLVDPLHNDTVTDAAFSFDGKKYVFSKPVGGI